MGMKQNNTHFKLGELPPFGTHLNCIQIIQIRGFFDLTTQLNKLIPHATLLIAQWHPPFQKNSRGSDPWLYIHFCILNKVYHRGRELIKYHHAIQPQRDTIIL